MRKMNVKAYLKIKVINEKGKCIYYRRYRSRSFVANFINIMFANLSGQNVTLVNTGGSTYGSFGRTALSANDSSNDASYGIQIGSGTTAPAITDYRLTQLIPNGTSAGQMQYGAVNVMSPVINTTNNTGYITVTRAFTNNSGGSITVSEVGLVVNAFSQYTLIIHDLLPTPITVPNGSTLSIAYEIQIAT
jgi:hypothetical protein